MNSILEVAFTEQSISILLRVIAQYLYHSVGTGSEHLLSLIPVPVS